MRKEAKGRISMQNHSFEVAIIIVLSSWQLPPYHGEERSYGKNDSNYSLSIHFSF